MTCLVAIIGSGKGTWNQLLKLINAEEWEKVILVGKPFFTERFERFKTTLKDKNLELIKIDFENKNYDEIVRELTNQLSKLITGTEVALNLTSGTGKEHMSIISAILKTGLGIRFVDFDNGVKEV